MTAPEPRTLPALAAILTLLAGSSLLAEQPGAPDTDDDAKAQVGLEELARTPVPVAPTIQGPRLPAAPAPGQGRLSLVFEGNRRWCTFPDDRVMVPPQPLTARASKAERNAVYTFGYQFTVAAVERTRPYETLMLFESPVIRTAVYRQAAKVGKVTPKPRAGPAIMAPQQQTPAKTPHIEPSTLVPAWQEQYRCTELGESFDFDLAPGTYDVYMAFDILLRSGTWSHRTVGFGTDIPVEAGRTTRVDARANMGGPARRELGVLGADLADPVAPAAQP